MSEVKTYSLDQISEHNNKNSVWILIHGNVYDVTKFLEEVCEILIAIWDKYIIILST